MIEALFTVVTLAGLCSGAILGVNIPTNTEQELRSSARRFVIFLESSSVGVILNVIINLIFLVTAFTLTAIAILYIGGAYPLSQVDRYVFCASWFIGAAFAKLARYVYWKQNA